MKVISERMVCRLFSSVEDEKQKLSKVIAKYGNLIVNLHFCCSRVALNFDTFFGACWGTGASEATSSCFLSRIVGRAGGAMVRWGIVVGIGSFSTTVPEKACGTETPGKTADVD